MCDECEEKRIAPHVLVNDICSVCDPDATVGLRYELDIYDFSYTVRDIGTATDTEIVIPNFYNSLPVTSIAGYAFQNHTSLTSVTIPDSVTSIGGYAFSECIVLTDVYYKGNEEEWTNIYISYGNYYLINATIHFNYTEE